MTGIASHVSPFHFVTVTPDIRAEQSPREQLCPLQLGALGEGVGLLEKIRGSRSFENVDLSSSDVDQLKKFAERHVKLKPLTDADRKPLETIWKVD